MESNVDRRLEAAVDPLFFERWSPRAFSDRPLTHKQIQTLFESTRWTSSSFNLQPWLFLYATDGHVRKAFNSLLTPTNQVWATKAPLLIFALAKRSERDIPGMPTSLFDTGAACMSLALQARVLGLYSHQMGGIDRTAAAYAELNVPADKYRIVCAIAVGERCDATELPADLRRRELPSDRKPLAEVALKGRFKN